MSTKLTNYIIGSLLLVALIATYAIYPQLPAQFADHWDAAGDVNGYMSKFWGVALVPLIYLGLWALFSWIPKIDPLKNNIDKSRSQYNQMILAIMIVLLGVHKATILWNLGYEFNIGSAIGALVSGLFIILGLILPKIKRNYFIGIRTPWTLNSDKVWSETHRRSGPVFVGAGIVSLVAILISPVQGFWVMITAILIATIWITWLSYVLFKNQ
ncbi:SdpI family protein [Candidatus Berkelbacteria bacterium]|nr:SdpI family protein [Candidatus Berkelbacteria bacterium]